MRIFFIPGLGEKESIFHKIEPFIPGEKILLDNWTLLIDVPEKDLNALQYAKVLIEQFSITKEDVVIGHSLGGWVALQIKQLTQCRIVQIASFTNSRKILFPLPSLSLIYWMARRGYGLNSLSLRFILWLQYRNKPSRAIYAETFERMKRGDKNIVVKQLKVVLNPVKEARSVSPDLRIHAKEDRIVKYPDEPFVEVPGDHFALYTFPEAVYEPIVKFLKQ